MASKLGVTGLIAKFLLNDFEKGKRRYEKGLQDIQKVTQKTATSVSKETDKMTKSFDEFLRKSEGMKKLDDIEQSSVLEIVRNLSMAFGDLGKNAEINIGLFDRLISQNYSYGDALKIATGQAEVQATGIASVVKGLAAYATAITVAYKTTQIYINFVKDSIASFQDLSNEIRRVQLQTGIAAEEADLWVTAARIQGVSSRSLAAGFAQVSRNLTNMGLKLAAGKEDNTNFARTIRAIGIEVKNTDGSFKDMTQVTDEVNEFIRELGPGWEAAGVAQNIYGRGASNILPIILDESVSLEELSKQLKNGAGFADSDRKVSDELREATVRLDIAKREVANTISRVWIPIWTEMVSGFADAIKWIDGVDNRLRALNEALRLPLGITFPTGPTPGAVEDLIEFFKKPTSFAERYNAELERLNGITEETAKAESKLTAERQAALAALFAETEATEDLVKEEQKLIDKLNQLSEDYTDKQEDVALRFSRRWADIQTKRWFDEIERSIRFNGKLNELAIKHQQKLADIQGKRGSGVKEVQDKVNKKLRDADRDAQEKREKLERTHRDRLVDIRNDYLDTVEEAARSNDAVAVLKARRRQAIAIRDEGLKNSRSQRELNIDLNSKRDQIREDAVEKAKEEQDDYDEQIARANLAYQRQVDALKRKSIEDAAVLTLKYREEKQQFDEAKRRAYEDALTWYNREQEALKAQMNELGIIVVDGVAQIGVQVAAATGNAVATIANAAGLAMEAAARQWANRHAYLGGATTPPTSNTDVDAWYRNTQPGGHRARGGFDIARKPTRYMAGEEGTPEAAIFIPMRNGTLNHNFGNMDLNFNGLPPGMDQSQVTAIVMEVMMSIAQQV